MSEERGLGVSCPATFSLSAAIFDKSQSDITQAKLKDAHRPPKVKGGEMKRNSNCNSVASSRSSSFPALEGGAPGELDIFGLVSPPPRVLVYAGSSLFSHNRHMASDQRSLMRPL